MYLGLTKRFRDALKAHIREKYGLDIVVGTERPPKIELGEAASPVCFELAKRLKRAPRQIAQEIATNLGPVPGIAKRGSRGRGYLNAYFWIRAAFWQEAQQEAAGAIAAGRADKIIVEHTSINPNKAAHIGHVRNAVLGDTIARSCGTPAVACRCRTTSTTPACKWRTWSSAFVHMEKKISRRFGELAAQPNFDYLCWDVYARVTQFYGGRQSARGKLRGETLKAIEEGHGEVAEMGAMIADAIVSLHLRTMARLGIWYDLLARESEILHLHFWDAAFEKLKVAGAIQLATTGKMAGCWIMPAKETTM